MQGPIHNNKSMDFPPSAQQLNFSNLMRWANAGHLFSTLNKGQQFDL